MKEDGVFDFPSEEYEYEVYQSASELPLPTLTFRDGSFLGRMHTY